MWKERIDAKFLDSTELYQSVEVNQNKHFQLINADEVTPSARIQVRKLPESFSNRNIVFNQYVMEIIIIVSIILSGRVKDSAVIFGPATA